MAYVYSALPYMGAIPGGLQLGKIIVICGHIPHGAGRVCINLCNGKVLKDDQPSNIGFHMSLRFDNRTTVFNSRVQGAWQKEEVHPLPLEAGINFQVMILVENGHFMIAANGRHFAQFNYRVPYSSLSMIQIFGTAQVTQIEFRKQTFSQVGPNAHHGIYPPGHPPVPICPTGPVQPPPPYIGAANPYLAVCPTGPVQPPPPYVGAADPYLAVCPPALPLYSQSRSDKIVRQPFYNPTLPFSCSLYEGLHSGEMIYISGHPTASPYRFVINLQTGTGPYPPPDVAFHFNPRFDNRSVVRNAQIKNNWGNEESNAPFFPFSPHVNFDMIIHVEDEKYMVAVNGQHFTEFKHRVMPLSTITVLAISGDVVLTSVRFK
ncbi:galectin-8-like isoform X2 [Limulus polyphemus]|uniref:Galectin n=1 Tax=Limulus polyphemus TaxID=6850 RepID=A0ABM1SLW2_LIMPO|nr:galectin-8-like isoform X2 [Limulus polyphemus]